MNQKIFKNTGKSGLFLMVLLCLYLGATDLEVYRLHFNGDKPFSIGNFLAEFWPAKIISVAAFFVVFIFLLSTQMQNKLGNLRVSGNILIPTLYLLFGIMIFVLLLKNQTYEAERSIEEVDQIFWIAAYVLITNIIFYYVLHHLNSFLARPAHITVMAVMGITSLYCMKLWFGYIFSGQIQFA